MPEESSIDRLVNEFGPATFTFAENVRFAGMDEQIRKVVRDELSARGHISKQTMEWLLGDAPAVEAE